VPGHAMPVPGWVRWVARDSSGVWWGYSVEPLRNDTGWYENEVGRCIRLGVSSPEGWERSLESVKPA
jgi:hypothetical protein